MTQKTHPHFTAFMGLRRLAAGPLAEVALAVRDVSRRPAAPSIIIFDDATGHPVELPPRLAGLAGVPQHYGVVPNDLHAVRARGRALTS